MSRIRTFLTPPRAVRARTFSLDWIPVMELPIAGLPYCLDGRHFERSIDSEVGDFLTKWQKPRHEVQVDPAKAHERVHDCLVE
jgi:hypothetical protein